MGQCCAGKQKPPPAQDEGAVQNNPLEVMAGDVNHASPQKAEAVPAQQMASMQPDPNVAELQKQVAALTAMIAEQTSQRNSAAKVLPPAEDSDETESEHNILAGVMESKSHAVPSPSHTGRGRRGQGRDPAGSFHTATPPGETTERPRRRRPPPPAHPAPGMGAAPEREERREAGQRDAKKKPEVDEATFDFKEEMYSYKGKPKPDRVRTLLLIGETGSGKSTLVNAMANWAAGVEYNSPVRYRLVVEPAKDQAFSQTQSVTSYLVSCEKYSFVLRLIDTPGFGDTSGVERDEQITKDIYTTLQKEDEIHGVCFVAAASLPRLTVTQQYIINKVLTMFGTDAVANIFLLITFADGKKAQVLNAIKASGFPFDEKACFHFNNSALFAKGEDRNEYSKNFWNMGEGSMSNFFEQISTKEPFNLTKTKDVIATQEKLQNYVASITPQVFQKKPFFYTKHPTGHNRSLEDGQPEERIAGHPSEQR